MDAADDLLHNKLAPQRMTPRKTTYLSCPGSSRGRAHGFQERHNEPLHMISSTRPAPRPSVPVSSRKQQQLQDENRRSSKDDVDDDSNSSDPASRIWAKIRRCSGMSLSHHRRNISTSSATSVAASVNLPFSTTYGADDKALRRKKAGISEGGLMVQRQRLAAMGSKQSLVDRTNLSDSGVAVDHSKRRNTKGSVKGRRSSGRWVFGNWWLNV